MIEIVARILIADDEPVIRLSLRRLLEAHGHEVIEARDGTEALGKIRSEHPDIALLDQVMPGTTGSEVCRQVRTDPGGDKIPIALLSAPWTPEDSWLALETGADRFLSKPFSDEEVLKAVGELLGGRQRPGEPE